MRHHVGVGLDLLQKFKIGEQLDDVLAGREAVHAGKVREHAAEIGIVHIGVAAVRIVVTNAGGVDAGFRVEHVDHGQVVAAAHLEVVEVVRGRDLDRARALLGSEYSSATMGMRRPMSGRMTCLPTRSA